MTAFRTFMFNGLFILVLFYKKKETHQILKPSFMQSTSAGDQPAASASASGVQDANPPSYPHQKSQPRRIVDAKGNFFIFPL